MISQANSIISQLDNYDSSMQSFITTNGGNERLGLLFHKYLLYKEPENGLFGKDFLSDCLDDEPWLDPNKPDLLEYAFSSEDNDGQPSLYPTVL